MQAFNYLLNNQPQNGFGGGIMDALMMAQALKKKKMMTQGTQTPISRPMIEEIMMPKSGIPKQSSPIFDKSTLSVNYGDVVKKGGHRNWRNNNPGNIEYGDFAKRHGAIGSDGRFAIFPDMDTGYGAQKSLLTSGSYRDLTLGDAISRYAPRSENDTGAYLGTLVERTGISPTERIANLSDDQLNYLLREMSKVEGMKAGEINFIGGA